MGGRGRGPGSPRGIFQTFDNPPDISLSELPLASRALEMDQPRNALGTSARSNSELVVPRRHRPQGRVSRRLAEDRTGIADMPSISPVCLPALCPISLCPYPSLSLSLSLSLCPLAARCTLRDPFCGRFSRCLAHTRGHSRREPHNTVPDLVDTSSTPPPSCVPQPLPPEPPLRRPSRRSLSRARSSPVRSSRVPVGTRAASALSPRDFCLGRAAPMENRAR